jgi:hypothetical protein
MNFPFNCLGCGYENYAEWSHIGRQVYCGRCGRVATVPAPMEPFAKETESGLAVRFACPVCGRNFATKRALIGQKVRCSGCGAGVRVPAGNSFPVEDAARVALNATSAASRTVAPTTKVTAGARVPAGNSFQVANAPSIVRSANSGGSYASPPAPPTTAPVWSAPANIPSVAPTLREKIESIGGLDHRQPTAVVLPSRAETMEQVRQEVAEQDAVATKKQAEKAKRAKKKKRKKAGFFDPQETMALIGGVSVVVGLLALLAYYLPDFHYPLGGLLALIGFVFYLLGAMSIRRIAESESDSMLKVLAYRFFPPYQLWFVVTHWEVTRDFFAFIASGILIMGIGGAVVMTSPTAKRASRNERAFQDLVDIYVRGKEFKPPPPVMKKADKKDEVPK